MRLTEVLMLVLIGLVTSFGAAVAVFGFSTMVRVIAAMIPCRIRVRYVIKPAIGATLSVALAASIACNCAWFDSFRTILERPLRIRG